jgi:hypothetical protein
MSSSIEQCMIYICQTFVNAMKQEKAEKHWHNKFVTFIWIHQKHIFRQQLITINCCFTKYFNEFIKIGVTAAYKAFVMSLKNSD